ncbi:Ubiquitin carboxyl-terminal hydrolase bap1, partial [Cichlidogyrus casuarinus]
MTVKEPPISVKSSRSSDKNSARPNEWYELESDPGLFTLLLEDFGVKGVQVEEVYDIQKPPTGIIYGFIFLFKWQEKDKKKSRRSIRVNMSDSEISNQPISNNSESDDPGALRSSSSLSLVKGENPIFFAHQMVPNSCATHALLSVLLNHREIDIGTMLKEFLEATKNQSPRIRGLSIGFMPQLSHAHNRHASAINRGSFGDFNSRIQNEDPDFFARSAQKAVERALAVSSSEDSPSKNVVTDSLIANSSEPDTFHFICFLPIHGHLFELDGLKPDPIDHGCLRSPHSLSDWSEQCFEIIQSRMNEKDSRFNLMAVVPDKCLSLNHKIEHLKKNHHVIMETLKRLKSIGPITVSTPLSSVMNEIRKEFTKSRERNPSGDSSTSSASKSISKQELAQVGIKQSPDLEDPTREAEEDSPSLISTEAQLSLKSSGDSENSYDSDNLMSLLTPVNTFTIADLWKLLDRIRAKTRSLEASLKEEVDRRTSYRIDDARRIHDYRPFIQEYLLALQRHGLLNGLIEKHQKSMSACSSPQINGGSTAVESPIAIHSSSLNPPQNMKRENVDIKKKEAEALNIETIGPIVIDDGPETKSNPDSEEQSTESHNLAGNRRSLRQQIKRKQSNEKQDNPENESSSSKSRRLSLRITTKKEPNHAIDARRLSSASSNSSKNTAEKKKSK